MTTSATENPEQLARRQIDAMLLADGSDVQDRAAMNLAAAPAPRSASFMSRALTVPVRHRVWAVDINPRRSDREELQRLGIANVGPHHALMYDVRCDRHHRRGE